MIRLGLIGDQIRESRSPVLHRLAGQLCGLRVSYERLIPAELGCDFDTVFDRARAEGFRGVNVTYPYKEAVVARLAIEDPQVRAIGACNTALFGGDAPRGCNTDYSGFMHAFRAAFGEEQPGCVTIVGAGGAGKAIAFALARLGASELRLVDTDSAKTQALAASLGASTTSTRVVIGGSLPEAADGCDGIVNCTPLGMSGIPGSAVPKAVMPGRRWAFDAVYTPIDTEFLTDARACGLETMSGYELFFHQGVDAFHAFTGCVVDEAALRAALANVAREAA